MVCGLPSSTLVEHGYVRRRRGHFGTQQLFQDPPAAQHRTGAVGERRDRQDARVPEYAAAGGVIQLHAPHLRSLDAVDLVVGRQPLIDERVVGVDHLQDAAVFANDGVEEEDGLLAHRRRQLVVEFRERPGVRPDGVAKRPGSEPLGGEPIRQAAGTRVAHHPSHLPAQNHLVVQLALCRQCKERSRPASRPRGSTTDGTPFRSGRACRFLSFRQASRSGTGNSARSVLP